MFTSHAVQKRPAQDFPHSFFRIATLAGPPAKAMIGGSALGVDNGDFWLQVTYLITCHYDGKLLEVWPASTIVILGYPASNHLGHLGICVSECLVTFEARWPPIF